MVFLKVLTDESLQPRKVLHLKYTGIKIQTQKKS